MRPGWNYLLGATLIAPGLLVVTLGQRSGLGNEPSRFGRFFRFSGSSASSTPAAPSSSPALLTPSAATSLPTSEPSVPETPGPSATPRIVPRPRVSRPPTESDPIVTRITLNRSDDGNQFGMFLQVFADGTVIDSEGVHHVGRDVLKPLIDALQGGDLYRVKGHCGAPATDYVESVHVTVYERSRGHLRANAFSYSGNPQGCDNAVRHLHATLDAIQSKITRTFPAGTTPGPASAPPLAAPLTGFGPTVIPLTPTN